MLQRSDIRLIASLIAVIGLLPVVFTGQACAELAAIQLKYRPADEIIPVIQPFLGPGDTLSGKDFLVFLNTTPERRIRIEAIIANLDRAPQQLAITVVQGEDTLAAMNRLVVSGNVTIGDHVTVGIGNHHGSAGDHLSLDAHHGNRTQRGNDIQRVLVQDGATARIHVGLSAPVPVDPRDHQGMRHHEVHTIREVLTGVSVTPRLSGDRVILNLDTRQERPAGDGGLTVRTQKIHTRVQVHLNEWMDIGGILSESSREATGMVYGAAGRQSSRSHVFVRVETVP